jgi:hypothetical protein
MDWQAATALGIVAITLGRFGYHMLQSKKTISSCGHSCGCKATRKKPDDYSA